MQSNVLTLKQLQALFYMITVNITALNSKYVRHAYPSDGQPAWTIDEDVVFINVLPSDNPYDKFRETSYAQADHNNAQLSTFYTRVIQVTWEIYGPNSFDYADTLRSGVLSDPIRGMLAPSFVYPLPNISAPSRVPYNFQGQWWERTDLQALFNVATNRVVNVPYLTGAAIELIDENGEQRLLNVTP